MSDSKDYYQEKAAKDCDEGEFNPPLNLITEIGASEKELADDKAYRDSWRNHKDQTSD